MGAIEVSIGGAQRLTTTYYFAGGQRIAMREGVTVTYLHGDHLGSASLATNASGAKVSDMRYTPFGEVRYGDAPTDRRFTGQREEAGIGLYDFNARFYSSGLGRFISADSIVTNYKTSQSLNRYSYAVNNPLRYNDTDGHCGPLCWLGIVAVLSVLATVPNSAPMIEPTPDTALDIPLKVYSCGTLPECQGKAQRSRRGAYHFADFAENEPISTNDFNALLETVYQDVRREWTPPVDLKSGGKGIIFAALAGRGWYDTPFWNAYDDTNDTVVCVEGHECYPRSEINYFAQGMWSAAAGETLEELLELVKYWNEDQYGHPAREGELYWAEFGWRWYIDQSQTPH